MYQTLSNQPLYRDKITPSNCWWDGAFSIDELDQIDYFCNKDPLDESWTFGAQNNEDVRRHRRSKVKFFCRDDNTAWIFDKFNNVGQSLNEQYYNFNLNGYESFQYTVYYGNDNGCYDWHMDMATDGDPRNHLTFQTRKLTMVLMLNEPGVDFTGGEFEITMGDQNCPSTLEIKKGRIICFPSFIIHRVKPVLTGIRKSIVIWIEGPKFI